MRKTVLLGALLALTTGTICAPAVLAADPEFKFHAEIVSRQEHVENFTDFKDSEQSAFKDNINFGFYRARIGAHADVGDGISGYIEMQNHGNWGDSIPFHRNPQDPALSGIQATGVTGQNDTQLYQAWIEWANIMDSMVTVKLGRQEHVLGNELHIGDQDFYAGQYFDGVRVGLDFETWDLDAFFYTVQERNTLPGSIGTGIDLGTVNGGSDDETFGGVTAAIEIADGHNIEPYVLLYNNDREQYLPGVDPEIFFAPKYNTITFGFLYDRPEEHESAMDWSLEFATQVGDAGQGALEVDIDSNVIEGWFGYTFGEEDESHHRLHVGGLILGDGGDPQDIEAFIPLFPDTHRRMGSADIFSMFSSSLATLSSFTGGFQPFSSFHNVTNYNVGWKWANDGQMEAGIVYHIFEATEDHDLLFDDELGSEIDAWFERHWSDHLTSQFGLAAFSPGDAFKEEFAGPDQDDTVLRVWLQAKFRI